MRYDDRRPSPSLPLVIAAILRRGEITGVDTHIRTVRRYLEECGQASTLVTPFSRGRLLIIMETMAAVLLIVAADTGPISEVCDESLKARFRPLDDTVQAAAILIDLLDNESARLRAARAAQERFRREHDAAVAHPELCSFPLETSEQHPRELESMR